MGGDALLDEGWPLVLLALRIGAVVLLYVFLLTAFRTLWADLRTPAMAPDRPTDRERAPARPRAVPAGTFEEDLPPLPPPVPSRAALAAREAWPPDEWEEAARRDVDGRGWRRVPARVALPVAAGVALVVLGGVAIFAGDEPPAETATTVAPTSEPFAPPAVAPAPNRVTVGLAAPEDAQVRVTVDGVVQFDGTLRAGQRQSWEGGERIQVWTDNGRNLLLAVNGQDLGPYSPAMGHPDWNRIDFGFWPGWAQ